MKWDHVGWVKRKPSVQENMTVAGEIIRNLVVTGARVDMFCPMAFLLIPHVRSVKCVVTHVAEYLEDRKDALREDLVDSARSLGADGVVLAVTATIRKVAPEMLERYGLEKAFMLSEPVDVLLVTFERRLVDAQSVWCYRMETHDGVTTVSDMEIGDVESLAGRFSGLLVDVH